MRKTLATSLIAGLLAVVAPMVQVALAAEARAPRSLFNGVDRAGYEAMVNDAALLSHRAHLPPCNSIMAAPAQWQGFIRPDAGLRSRVEAGTLTRIGWEKVTTRGCGYAQVQNVFVFESPRRTRGEGPAVRAGVPGNGQASFSLSQEVFAGVIARAQTALSAEHACAQAYSGVLDVRVEERAATGWRERWAVLLCGHVVDIGVDFRPLTDGGTRYDTYIAAAPVPLRPPHAG